MAAALQRHRRRPEQRLQVHLARQSGRGHTNGTAVLRPGRYQPLAGKPVMEGKGVLFKKFAGIDVFDIEVNENDPDKLVDIICALSPL